MRARLALALVLPLVLVATACRSPFGSPPPEEGPDAGRVGRGIHGWPLLEHAPHGAGWRTDLLWPGYSQVRTDGDGLNQTDILYPIFHMATEGGRHRTGLFRPLFDLETEGDEIWDLDVVWPLFKWRDSPTTWERRAFPLYRAAGDTDGPDRELDLLWPLYREAETEAWVESHLFPVYWNREARDGTEGYTHVWPLWGREYEDTWERTWLGLPLFASTTDAENNVSQTDLLYPLVHWGHDGDENHTRVLPLLWHREDGSESENILFPVWWDMRDDDWSFTMLFPLYGSYTNVEDVEATTVGGPLFVGGHDGDEDFTWLAAPLVHWRSSPHESGGHLFPVFWWERDEDGDGYTNLWPLFGWENRGKSTTASIATPFLSYEWDDDSWELDLPWPLVGFSGHEDGGSSMIWPLFDHESDEGETEGNVLFFLSTWESDEAQDERDFRILWRLVESSRNAGKDTFVINPLFRHESNDAGDSYWSFLFGLIARKQEAGATDWRFLWLF